MEKAHIELRVPSQFLYIPPTLAFIKRLAEQFGFSQARIKDIELTIDEICGNAIEHGSETAASGIVLTVDFDATKLEIRVQDKGKSNKEGWLGAERLDDIFRERSPNGERGHGIYIAHKLSDDLEIIQPNSFGGTDVRVFFFLSRPRPS